MTVMTDADASKFKAAVVAAIENATRVCPHAMREKCKRHDPNPCDGHYVWTKAARKWFEGPNGASMQYVEDGLGFTPAERDLLAQIVRRSGILEGGDGWQPAPSLEMPHAELQRHERTRLALLTKLGLDAGGGVRLDTKNAPTRRRWFRWLRGDTAVPTSA